MIKNKFVVLLSLGLLVISLVLPSGITFAQSPQSGPIPTPEGPPPAGVYPSNVERVVSNPSLQNSDSPLIYCSSLWWDAKTDMHNGLFSTWSTSASKSRDSVNHNIACDITTIGARGRLWISGTLHSDTGMLESSNSADKTATTSGGDLTCGGVYQAQGNHEFYLAGVDSWYPITSNSC